VRQVTIRRYWTTVVAALVLLVTAPVGVQVYSAEYYVAQQHSQASNSNPGTAEQSWVTLGHATVTVQAGDTVWVKQDVYRELLILDTEGGDYPRLWPRQNGSEFAHGVSGEQVVACAGHKMGLRLAEHGVHPHRSSDPARRQAGGCL